METAAIVLGWGYLVESLTLVAECPHCHHPIEMTMLFDADGGVSGWVVRDLVAIKSRPQGSGAKAAGARAV